MNPRPVRKLLKNVAIGCTLLGSLALTNIAAAQDEASKARKYHAILLKRPDPGYLFDRFYATWLNESTVDQLREFLVQRAKNGDTADQLLLAFFHAKQGDDGASLEAYEQALADSPGDAAVLLHKAAAEARTLDFDAAIADLTKARKLKIDDKLSVRIEKDLGKLLVRNRQTQKALEVWNGLLAANPDDEELCEDVIELHMDEGLYKEAADLSAALIARTKDKYLAVTRRLRLGDIRYRAGSRANALESYATALDDVGNDTWIEREILAQIEKLFRREDDLTGAAKYFDEMLKKHPKRIAIHRRRARLLVDLGEHDEAIAAHRTILELTPGNRTSREEYISMLAKIERHEEAIAQLRALAEQHPKDAELQFQLAGMLHAAKKTDEAVAAAEQYVEASDGSEYAHLRSAKLLMRFERPEAAGAIYEKLVRAKPDSVAAKEAHAAFLYSQDNKEAALALWRKLAADADVNQTLHVVRALATRGEHEAAFELLSSRAEEYDDEPLFLGQLVTSAIAQKKYQQAIAWGRQRVQLADASGALETAIEQTALACERADKMEQIARELANVSARTVQQTCLLAELRERLGDSPGADAVLAKGEVADHVLGVSQQIRLHQSRRDWAQAAKATRRILELPGGRKSLHIRRLVELYQRNYQFAEALGWIDAWKQISPGSTLPWTTEAKLLGYQGQEKDALLVMRKAVQKFDDDADLRAKLAQMNAELGRHGDAEQLYWQLYEETEDLSGKLRWAQELAELAEARGKVEQLVAAFEERRRHNRRSIVPLLALSEIHRVTDRYEERRQALAMATKIKPDDLQLLLQIARIEEAEGEWQHALATLERAAELDTTDRTRRKIAQLHLNYGDEEKGFALLYDLAGAGDGDPRTVETIADAIVATGDWEQAAEFLAQRIDAFADDYRLRYLYGVTLEESGRIEAAVDQFQWLLNEQDELSIQPSGTQTALTRQNSYLQSMARVIPPEAMEWMTLSQYHHSAYSHQQLRHGGYYAPMARGGSRSLIQYPASAELVRPYALAHLIAAARMLDDEQIDQLSEELKEHGVTDAKLLIEYGGDRNGMMQSLPLVLEESPNHPAALAMFLMHRMGQRNLDSAGHAARAVKIFRDDYPELAFMAAMQAGAAAVANTANDEQSSGPMLDAALELAATIDNPSPYTVMAAAPTSRRPTGTARRRSRSRRQAPKKSLPRCC